MFDYTIYKKNMLSKKVSERGDGYYVLIIYEPYVV